MSRTVQASRLISLATLLGSAVLTSACGSLRSQGGEDEGRYNDDISLNEGAVILAASALDDGSGTVLNVMIGRVPSFRVLPRANQCPEIRLRSNVNARGAVNPHVYVDGTRATNTCILESLRADDIERVEVYPQGFTKRPGYGTHAHGLILVFMRSS